MGPKGSPVVLPNHHFQNRENGMVSKVLNISPPLYHILMLWWSYPFAFRVRGCRIEAKISLLLTTFFLPPPHPTFDLYSEEMEYVSVIVQEDAAHHLIDEIGEIGHMQFTDVSVTYPFIDVLLSPTPNDPTWMTHPLSNVFIYYIYMRICASLPYCIVSKLTTFSNPHSFLPAQPFVDPFPKKIRSLCETLR